MHRDTYQTIEDFLQDTSFRNWAQHGTDNDGWENWMKQDSDNTALAQEARLVLLAMGVPGNSVSETETEEALKDLWQRVAKPEPEMLVPLRSFPWRMVAAALLFLGIGLGWHLMKKPATPDMMSTHTLEKNAVTRLNQTPNPVLVMLEDGSSVVLQPGSRLHYPAVFEGKERKVSLTGEAFFEISKNPSRPFFVYAGETITRVTGTSFRIKAYGSQPAVEVIVRTGRVMVSAHRPGAAGKSEAISLSPNESVRFVRGAGTFEKPVAAAPDPTLPIERLQLDFEDTPVTQILDTIALAYGVKVHYHAGALRDCYLSTSLSDLPLPQKLKIICESMGGKTSYEMLGDRITVFSEGCN